MNLQSLRKISESEDHVEFKVLRTDALVGINRAVEE
jgi:hypothetical protein